MFDLWRNNKEVSTAVHKAASHTNSDTSVTLIPAKLRNKELWLLWTAYDDCIKLSAEASFIYFNVNVAFLSLSEDFNDRH